MSDPDLNAPEVRQALLQARAAAGAKLVASALAQEFSISLDTVRRDLLALENAGHVMRVRGGAVPATPQVTPLAARITQTGPQHEALADAALAQIRDGMVLIIDGGSTLTQLARRLPPMPNGLVVTPAPSVALACLQQGIPLMTIGGRVCLSGGVAVGSEAERAISRVSADLCFLGVCGLSPEFGLSADDPDEASLKACMQQAATTNCLLTTREKLGLRARHKVLPCERLDRLLTTATPSETAAYQAAGMEITHV